MIKKSFAVIILVLTCLIFVSCNFNSASITEAEITNDSQPTQKETEGDIQDYLQVGFPQLDREKQRLYYLERGKFADNVKLGTAVIYSSAQYEGSNSADVFITVDLNDTLLSHYIGNFEKNVLNNGSLYTADIDSDGIDEIVFNCEINNNGTTLSRIYKVNRDQLEVFADMNDSCFDSYGYSISYIGNGCIEICNDYTDDSFVQDVSDVFAEGFFDEKGYPIYEQQFDIGIGNSCLEIMVFDDGEYGLRYSQYITCGTIIGHTVTTLKYDEKTKSLKVVDAIYIPGKQPIAPWER